MLLYIEYVYQYYKVPTRGSFLKVGLFAILCVKVYRAFSLVQGLAITS